MHCFAEPAEKGVEIIPAEGVLFDRWQHRAGKRASRWVESHAFHDSSMQHLVVPDANGDASVILVKLKNTTSVFALGGLPTSLPSGLLYSYTSCATPADATAVATGWALGSYQFDRYFANASAQRPRLVPPSATDMDRVHAIARSTCLGRDLVNTPAEDMGPGELASTIVEAGRKHGATVRITAGDDLLTNGYPSVHAVGRASVNAPRLVDLIWGPADGLKVTLVGKGVCFDSGGLDIKPPAGMKLMKKDMGGAASAIALANMIMCLDLPVRLRLLVPAVENSISGNAFRPLDVVRTRKGHSIEIGDTDAEGRVILCDALAAACEEKPDLLLDFATLTGAARVALGTEVPALFCNDDEFAEEILCACRSVEDDLWRLPLWSGYDKLLKSDVADYSTTGAGHYGGAITAALFLQNFVNADIPWAHVDMMAWNLKTRPGRPAGGEVMAARGILEMLERRIAKHDS